MNVIKDLATVISMIVSTITIAGIYYSDNGEVEKRKKIFLKNIAIIITVTIRDDAGGHVYKDDPSQNRGPHFNDDGGNHYDY